MFSQFMIFSFQFLQLFWRYGGDWPILMECTYPIFIVGLFLKGRHLLCYLKCKYHSPCLVANQLNILIWKDLWKHGNPKDRRVMVILSGWGVYPVSPRESDEHTAFLDIVCQIFEQILYKRLLLENLTNTLQIWKSWTSLYTTFLRI